MFSDFKKNLNSGFFTVFFLANYRLGRRIYLSKYKKSLLLPIYFIVKLINRFLSVFLGCYIPFSCCIGKSVHFVHGVHGVFISSKAKIGNGCTILHHVTIGSNIGSSSNHVAPTIGNNVFIGVGTKIIGGVSIGDGCMLGAGSLVFKDVPANSKTYAVQAVVREK